MYEGHKQKKSVFTCCFGHVFCGELFKCLAWLSAISIHNMINNLYNFHFYANARPRWYVILSTACVTLNEENIRKCNKQYTQGELICLNISMFCCFFKGANVPMKLTINSFKIKIKSINKMVKATPHLFHPFIDSALGG